MTFLITNGGVFLTMPHYTAKSCTHNGSDKSAVFTLICIAAGIGTFFLSNALFGPIPFLKD